MKFHRLLILGAAAWAGTMFYKLQYVPTDADRGIAGTSAVADSSATSASDRTLYSDVNGPGSLGSTLRNSTNARSVAPVNPNYGNNNKGSLLQTKKRRTSPAVEDMAPDDMQLIQAAAKGDKNIVERKLSQRVKVDSRDSMRRTPLMYASWNGFDDIANRLIAAGANPSFKDRDGNDAFDYAASRGLVDSLHFLLQRTHSTDDNHYMEYAKIIQATYAANPTLLPEGNGKLFSVNRLSPEGQAPLHVAASNGSIELMQIFIKRGAQVNITNNSKQTPLHWAAWNNQAQAVQLLLSHGADITIADSAKNTPLLLAAQNNSIEAAKILLEKGADRYVANKEGKTPAIAAEDKGFTELYQLLK